MKEQFRGRLRTAALAATMVFGVGAEAYAQTPTTGESPRATEVEKLDVSPFIDAVWEGVDVGQDPKFFKQMQRRAENNPNKYFTKEDLSKGVGPTQVRWLYFPDGLETVPLSSQPKAAYIEADALRTGTMDDGVPSGIPYTVEIDEFYLDLGEDGTLGGDNSTDLFTYKRHQKDAERFFNEPQVLKDMEWTQVAYTPATQFSAGNPAMSTKDYVLNEELIEGFPSMSEGWRMQGSQTGLLYLGHYKRTIESLVVEELPKPATEEEMLAFGEDLENGHYERTIEEVAN